MSEKIDKYLGVGDMSIVDAMRKIDANAKGILYIVKKGTRILEGSVTDGDIRRRIISTGDIYGEIRDVMNRNTIRMAVGTQASAKSLFERYQVTSIPLVDGKGEITDILFAGDRLAEQGKKPVGIPGNVPVVIMAGGKGTRLYPYTRILPKPLIPVGDIPILERIMGNFERQGTEKFFVSVNYRKNMIMSYFSEMEHDIQYLEESKPLGTAGSLTLLGDGMKSSFFVTNCDIMIQADYGDMYRVHERLGNAVTVVTAVKNIEIPYGVLHTNERGSVASLEEKPRLSYLINTGMYVLRPEVLSCIPKDTFFHMTDLMETLLERGEPVGMYPVSEESFQDMGEFNEMRRMEERLSGNGCLGQERKGEIW